MPDIWLELTRLRLLLKILAHWSYFNLFHASLFEQVYFTLLFERDNLFNCDICLLLNILHANLLYSKAISSNAIWNVTTREMENLCRVLKPL